MELLSLQARCLCVTQGPWGWAVDEGDRGLGHQGLSQYFGARALAVMRERFIRRAKEMTVILCSFQWPLRD
jgi:hypothetical protein